MFVLIRRKKITYNSGYCGELTNFVSFFSQFSGSRVVIFSYFVSFKASPFITVSSISMIFEVKGAVIAENNFGGGCPDEF